MENDRFPIHIEWFAYVTDQSHGFYHLSTIVNIHMRKAVVPERIFFRHINSFWPWFSSNNYGRRLLIYQKKFKFKSPWGEASTPTMICQRAHRTTSTMICAYLIMVFDHDWTDTIMVRRRHSPDSDFSLSTSSHPDHYLTRANHGRVRPATRPRFVNLHIGPPWKYILWSDTMSNSGRRPW